MSVVLHLANGQDVAYHVSEEVVVLPDDQEPHPEALAAAAADDAEQREQVQVARRGKPATKRREV